MSTISLMKLIKWLIICALCLVYGVLAGAYITFRYLVEDFSNLYWYIIFDICVCCCFLLFFSLCLRFQKNCNKKSWDAKGYIRIGLSVIAVLSLAYFFIDEAPVKSKYTWDDVPSASETADESYELICTILKEDEKKINFGNISIVDVIDSPLSYEKEILDLWKRTEEERHIIEKLDSFEEVADLSTEETAVDYNYYKLVQLARLYGVYACLLTEKGNPAEGVRELAQFHSITLKALPFARFTIHKAIWSSVTITNINNAYRIARNTSCDKASLIMLRDTFIPLTPRAITYRGAFMSEYFFIVHESNIKESLNELFCSPLFDLFGYTCLPEWNQYLLKQFFSIIYHKNRTFNLLTKKLELMIDGASKHPPDLSEVKAFSLKFEQKPEFNNVGGWISHNSSFFDLTGFPGRMSKIKVRSDLLALYLSERLGENIELKDYLTGNEYHKTDEGDEFISLGPDGKFGSSDDIRLDE